MRISSAAFAASRIMLTLVQLGIPDGDIRS
jgi:hypothetical protein